jgi:hypothetical protein
MCPNIPESKVEVKMPPVKPPRKQITFKVSRLTKPWALRGTESAIRALSGNALDNFDIKLEINQKPKKMKQTKKPGDAKFWRNKFMQVLEALHDTELTWAKSEWARYGITEEDAALIEAEFDKQVQWRAERNKVDNKDGTN